VPPRRPRSAAGADWDTDEISQIAEAPFIKERVL
jgi:hypothetical protein